MPSESLKPRKADYSSYSCIFIWWFVLTPRSISHGILNARQINCMWDGGMFKSESDFVWKVLNKLDCTLIRLVSLRCVLNCLWNWSSVALEVLKFYVFFKLCTYFSFMSMILNRCHLKFPSKVIREGIFLHVELPIQPADDRMESVQKNFNHSVLQTLKFRTCFVVLFFWGFSVSKILKNNPNFSFKFL